MSGSGITMPDGHRYRISSVRRYIVVGHLTQASWTAIYRTDDLNKAVARWRKECRFHSSTPYHVIDARTADGPAVIR